MSETNRSITVANDTQVLVGIKKDLSTVSSLSLAGSTYTPVTLEQLIQSRIDLANTIAQARAHWLDVTATYGALNTKVTQVVRGLRQYVINAYGEQSPLLADFGFAPPKQATLTPEQKVARAAKAAATRKARGTMGKVAKQKVKGTVPVTVAAPTAPVPAPAAPAPVTTTAAPAVTVPAAAPHAG
jgi:hypothetical protein